jgi:murein DD-endopeptidase MepM/ murein hydrolase activator NlpD
MNRNKNIYFFNFLFFIIIIIAVIFSFPMNAYCNYKVPFIVPLNGNILLKFREDYIDTISKTGRKHTGIDIEGKPGEKIRASGNGVISYVGISPTGGRTIVIKHNDYIRTTYLNLFQIFVYKGESINQGDLIASIGSKDDPSNSKIHLHFGIIYQDKYLDPEDVFNIDYESISRFLYLKYIESDFRILRIE